MMHSVPGQLPPPPPRRAACAGGIVRDADGRLLLIRRGQEPSLGRWSVPGGRCEPGETAAEACVREVREETGLDVVVLGFAGHVERDGPGGVVYDIDDFACEPVGGELVAGGDALEARWVTRADLETLAGRDELAPGLAACLVEWGLLPD